MANGMMGNMNATNTNYKRPYKPMAAGDPKDVQKYGLGTAQDIVKQTTGRDVAYPTDFTSKLQAPARRDYVQNVGYQPFQTLAGGDFAQLRKDLAAPILEQDRLARNRIADVYSGRGLYGSVGGGFMSGAEAAQARATGVSLGNVGAQALALQQKENQARFEAQKAIADQMNQYQRDRLRYELGQEQAGIDFANRQLAAQAQYQLDRQRWRDAQDQIAFDRATKLAGLGGSAAGLQAQQDIARRQAEAAEKSALYRGLGTIGGGLLGSYDKTGKTGWRFGDLFN